MTIKCSTIADYNLSLFEENIDLKGELGGLTVAIDIVHDHGYLQKSEA